MSLYYVQSVYPLRAYIRLRAEMGAKDAIDERSTPWRSHHDWRASQKRFHSLLRVSSLRALCLCTA